MSFIYQLTSYYIIIYTLLEIPELSYNFTDLIPMSDEPLSLDYG